MPQLTPDERLSISRHLLDSAQRFREAIAGLGPSEWSFKPSGEVWSIAECADHVVAVEIMIFGNVSGKLQQRTPDPERAAAAQGKEKMLMRAVPDRTTRVKVPVAIEPTGRGGSPEELIGYFDQVRAKTVEYVQSTGDPLHDRTAPHFMFKDLNGAQWLLLISLHTERHVAQIEEVKADENYPRRASGHFV